jgi:hypothetical protein
MKFQDLLIAAIQTSEIPLRFEPGAEESVARPVVEMLQSWIAAHLPDDTGSEFDAGRRALGVELMSELDGSANVPE